MINDEFFQLFHRSAWRLEVLSAYGTPESDPDFAVFLEQGHLAPLAQRPRKRAWMDAVRQAVAEGKRLSRVHVVGLPLSPYLAYELATYPENAEVGEDIRIADVGAHPELGRLDQDFWLLDDKLVLAMRYDAEGRFLDLQEFRNPATVDRYRRRRELAVACSVPLMEFHAAA